MPENNRYPKNILPHPTYRRKLGLERLLITYPDLMVVRKVDGNPEAFIQKGNSGGEFLLPDVFKGNMANLSMNLAGGLFKTEASKDLRYLPTKDEAIIAWNGEEPRADLYDEYNYADECFGLCFMVRSIHRRTFPFFRHFDNQKARDEYAGKVSEIRKSNTMLKDAYIVGLFDSIKKQAETNPRIIVHHSPTMVNYWHVTLDTYRPTDTTYIKSGDKQSNPDKKMFISLKHDLVNHCKINQKPNYNLKRLDYKKPYTKKDCLADSINQLKCFL